MGHDDSLSGKRILIVEDNFLVAEELCQIVRDAHGEARNACASSHAALDALTEGQFDGALLDVQLQNSSSVEVARELAARHIPFVVVSGYSRDWLAPELRNAPYLAKPFNREELVELASRHFRP
ncbi:MAG TPA: response regulator [Reyranella sp.]|jgi:CheY-like chemotaxis protein|nr:response regulator [Reyranella sp.]